MASFLITGANRGIGLELVKQLLELKPTQVGKIFAISRSGSVPVDDSRLTSVTANITNEESLQNAVKEIEAVQQGAGLDVLVNNAGVSPKGPGKMELISANTMEEAFHVNVVGVQLTTSAFMPLLRKGCQKKVINISSTLGSVTWAPNWHMPYSFAYRISKSALGMLTQLYAMDHKEEGFTFLQLSPGWLKTDLGGSYADLEPEVGVADVRRIILEADSSMNGKFVNIRVPGWENNPIKQKYDGGEIPF